MTDRFKGDYQEFDIDVQEMLGIYLNFFESAKPGDDLNDDLTLISLNYHENNQAIKEDVSVRHFLEAIGVLKFDAPSYFETNYTQHEENDSIHIRLLMLGTTKTGVDFTVTSRLILDEVGATETVCIAPLSKEQLAFIELFQFVGGVALGSQTR